MKRFSAFVLVLLCFAATAWGQSISWSSKLSVPSVKQEGLHIQQMPNFIFEDSAAQRLYTLRRDGLLMAFDDQMTAVGQQQLDLSDPAYSEVVCENVVDANGEMAAIFSGKKKGENGVDVFAYLINKQELSIVKDNKYSLGTYKPKSELIVNDSKVAAHNIDVYDHKVRFASSANKQYFLMLLPGKVKGNRESCVGSVFKADLSLAWTGDLEMPYPDGQLSINDYEIDNNGNVYISGEEIHRFQQGVYLIFIYSNGQLIKEHSFKHKEDRRVFDMNIDASGKNLQCVGFYSKRVQGGYDGLSHIAISLDSHEVISETYTNFDDSILELFMSKSERKRKARGEAIEGVEIVDYTDKACVATPDGNVILLAEYNGIGKQHIASPQSYTRDGYFAAYGDIIAVKINAEGKSLWSHVVKKPLQEIGLEYGVVDYASFAYLMQGNRLNLYFNIAGKDRVQHVAVSIDGQGKKSRTVLGSYQGKVRKGELPWLVPEWIKPVGSHIVLYNAYDEDSYRLGLLKP